MQSKPRSVKQIRANILNPNGLLLAVCAEINFSRSIRNLQYISKYCNVLVINVYSFAMHKAIIISDCPLIVEKNPPLLKTLEVRNQRLRLASFFGLSKWLVWWSLSAWKLGPIVYLHLRIRSGLR